MRHGEKAGFTMEYHQWSNKGHLSSHCRPKYRAHRSTAVKHNTNRWSSYTAVIIMHLNARSMTFGKIKRSVYWRIPAFDNVTEIRPIVVSWKLIEMTLWCESNSSQNHSAIKDKIFRSMCVHLLSPDPMAGTIILEKLSENIRAYCCVRAIVC